MPEPIETIVARLQGIVEQMSETVRSFAPTARQVIDAEHNAEEARDGLRVLASEVQRVEERVTKRIDRSHEGLLREIGLVRTDCQTIRDDIGSKVTARIGARGTIIAALVGVAGVVLGKALG